MARPTEQEIAAMTPMLRQFYDLKNKAEDAILFFRMGDFYEIFGDDAEEVAPKLDIIITSRERGDKQKILFCGVPHHSAQGYWLKLLSLGYKIAIADQIEDPSTAKGLVARDIVRVLTPGCIDELEGLSSDSQNYIFALWQDPKLKEWAMAVADVSTSELRLGSAGSLEEVLKEISLFRPKEILARGFQIPKLKEMFSASQSDQKMVFSPLPEAALRDEAEQNVMLSKLFGDKNLKSQPCGEVPGGKALLSALFVYLKSLKAPVDQFLSVRPIKEKDTMALSDIAIRDLEIFETARRRQSEGSLFRTVNATLTPMGGRLLRWSFSHPFSNDKSIQARHDAIDILLKEGETKLLALRGHLKMTADLSRIATRIQSRRASPIELGKVRSTLSGLLAIEKTIPRLSPIFNGISEAILKTRPTFESLFSFLKDEPGLMGQGSDVFKSGFDGLLDEKVMLARGGEGAILAYEEKLKLETGITSLKIKSHQSFGLLIEVTKSHLSKVPSHFIRRQTMVNCERFLTMELKELDETLASARDQAILREAVLFENVMTELTAFLPEIYALGEAVGELDLIQSFAWHALKHDFVRPTLNPKTGLLLTGSRHPVVEHFLGRSKYVPNHIELTPDKKLLLITGPNMAGKSTVMRQVAVSAILCQIGAFVPAVKAHLPVFDQIFTRVGASDDLASGQSTFMVEMNEASLILRQATEKSLVILDEVGRGTSTQDGLAIASAILEDIAKRLQSWCLFATHYHELVPVAGQLAGVSLVKTEVEQSNSGIQFTHRLIPGASESSFGIEVAKLAGMPEHVLNCAKLFLETSSQNESKTASHFSLTEMPHSSPEPVKKPLNPSLPADLERNVLLGNTPPEGKLDDSLSDLISKLESLNLNRMTPLQALNQLAELKDLLRPQNHVKPRGLFDLPAH